MNVMKRAVLLLLVVAVGSNADTDPTPEVVAATPDPCHGLTNKVHLEDLYQFNGYYVLFWSVSDHEDGHRMLANLQSSHVEFNSDNETFIMTERNLYKTGAKRRDYFINQTIHHVDNDTDHNHHGDERILVDSIREEVDGLPSDYNDTGHISVFESCPDCLLILYKWREATFLLGYGKDGHHQDAEKLKTVQEDHKQRAVCLGFTNDKPYSYDGIAELALTKSAPVVEQPATDAPAS